MSTVLSKSELETYLWGAAVILRGLVEAGDYKQYAFPLIFFKRLSDVWDEDHAAALAESKDEAYATASANDRFVNPGRLDGIFGDAPWTNKERLPDVTLKNLLEHFSTHTLSLANVPEDELGN